MIGIPCIDIGPFYFGNAAERAAIAKSWGTAFEEVGFATIVGHGVPDGLAGRLYRNALKFFEQPLATKLLWQVPDRVKTKGYLPVGIESVARTRGDARPADLCEALVFSSVHLEPGDLPADGRSPVTGNLYPADPADLTNSVRLYFRGVYDLAGTLMRISALALDLPEEYFKPFIDRRRGTLRAVLYPDQPEEPKPGQLRYGAHSDYGGLTILRQDDAPGGLQVFTRSGEWIDVTPVPGSFVINIGDLMARWTIDRWRSTLHRVKNPPRDAAGSTRRLSLVMFTGPNDDAIIECLPTCATAARPAQYPPVKASDYIRDKLNASMPEALARNLQRQAS